MLNVPTEFPVRWAPGPGQVLGRRIRAVVPLLGFGNGMVVD